MDEEPAGWNGSTRIDAMEVILGAESRWIIMPPDERPAIRFCPCCRREFRTALAAKRVADAVYPMPSGPTTH